MTATYSATIESMYSGGRWKTIWTCFHNHKTPQTAEQCAERELSAQQKMNREDIAAGFMVTTPSRIRVEPNP